MTATPRPTNNGTPKSRNSGGTAVLAFLIAGVIALLFGIAGVSSSHENPADVICDRQAMRPGDTCTTYSNNAPTRIETYDQVRAEHIADIQRGKTFGPLMIVVAVLLAGGAVLSAVVARSGSPSPSSR